MIDNKLSCNYEVIKDVDQDIDEMAFFPFYTG